MLQHWFCFLVLESCRGCSRTCLKHVGRQIAVHNYTFRLKHCNDSVRFTMADGRPAKLARVQRLRSRLPFVSQSGLAALLREAQSDEGLPDITSRRSIGRARDAAVNVETPYGPLHRPIYVQQVDGPPLRVEIQDPFAMLYHVCNTSSWFAGKIVAMLAAQPCTVVRPWSLVLYTDEILPGNQLGYKSARKMWGFYWSIMEMGMHALSDEALSHCASQLKRPFACCSMHKNVLQCTAI